MSFQRAFIILQKDLYWAKQNSKLLALMVMPVFLMLFFSRLDSGGTFGFSLSFINAFVGIFSTSYLITEEKNKGTLVSLLTTPLKGSELLLGKFLFNLILCLTFTLLSMLLNNRFDLLTRPFALLNCFFFAGTTCFFGYTLGVFFKNEKEMSVLAPFLLIFFAMGDAMENLSDQVPIGGFFPSYHLVQSLKEVPPLLSQQLIHTLFTALMFVSTFFMASLYTKFYFSNHRDGKRLSLSLVLTSLAFISVLVVSGFYTMEYGSQAKLNKANKEAFEIETQNWKIQFDIDRRRFFIKNVIDTKARQGYLVKEKKNDPLKVFLSVRKLKDAENSFEKRKKHFASNFRRQVMADEESKIFGYDARNWVYLYKGEQTVLQEVICGDEIFQWGLDQKLKKMKGYERNFKTFLQLSKRIKIQCKLNQNSTGNP